MFEGNVAFDDIVFSRLFTMRGGSANLNRWDKWIFRV